MGFRRSLLTVLLPLVILTGCGSLKPDNTGKVQVYTSIYPLYDFAVNIGGERVNVHNILPPGAEPHHWEPAPGDVAEITGADLFLYCGAGLEPWAPGLLKNMNEKTVVTDCSRGVDLIQGDPHIWLNPANAMKMVDNVQEGLVNADPGGSDYYAANAAAYRTRLQELDEEYKNVLSGAQVRVFVVSHAAFGYLADRYGLQQVPVRGLTADAEPSPARMAEVVEIIKAHGIEYIFFEELVSPRVTETIARETGAGVLVLNPMGGLTREDLEAGKNYLVVMRENLSNLKKACKVR